MKDRDISAKISRFFYGLVFGNLKTTKITKIVIATIILPKGTHVNGSNSYQNVQVY